MSCTAAALVIAAAAAACPADQSPSHAAAARTAATDPEGKTAAERFGAAARFYRFDEDYRFLRRDRARGFPLDLKQVPAAHEAYLSIGGDYRARIDGYDEPAFGRAESSGFVSLQQRFLVHADVEVGESVRAFVQLGAATEAGREPAARAPDRSAPDLVQAFVDLRAAGRDGPSLRVGRQEFVLGRYVSIREFTNFRRAFDGVRLDARTGRWAATAFLGQQVVNRPGAFDDDSGRSDRVALLSATLPVAEGLQIDGVLIARRLEGAVYAQGTGLERRRTYSARLWGGRTGWTLDAQLSYQDGSLTSPGRQAQIGAWGISTQAELLLRGPARPRLGLRLDAVSGDRDPADGRLGTFDVPYPNLSYLTDATIFAPRNNVDVQPYVTLNPSARLALTVGDQLLWRARKSDALYNAGNIPIVPPGGSGSFVAHQPYLRTAYRLSPFVNLQASYLHAFRGQVLKQAGATSDLNFFFAEVEVRF